MKRWFVALTVATACLGLFCARTHPSPGITGDVLNRHLSSDPATLDPTTTNEELGLRVEDLIFRPMIGIDARRHSAPGLALSWLVSPDGLRYELHLDPKARWEDGSPVTSKDVAFTIGRVRDPKVPAVNWRPWFDDVLSVETPSALTAIVLFRRPYAARLLGFSMPVVSAAAYVRAADVDRKPIGTGPYRLEKWVSKQAITLRRRADASATVHPFATIAFRIVPDNAVRFQAGTRGDLDEFFVTRDQVPAAQSSPEFQSRNRLIRVPQFLVVMVVWNCRNPVLADVRVRRALAMALPRADIAKRLYPPEGAALVSGPYPPGAPENAPDVQPPRYDPQASRQLLEEAGFKMGPGGFRRRGDRAASLELLYTTLSPIYRNMAEILQDSYRKVGVELVLRPLDWAAYVQRLAAGEYDAAPTADSSRPPNVDPYARYHSSQTPPNGDNTGSYKNSEADRLMEAAQREMDDGKRLKLLRQVHRLLAADPPADFLWDADQYWGISKRIEGVETSPFGLFHFLPGPLGWRLSLQ